MLEFKAFAAENLTEGSTTGVATFVLKVTEYNLIQSYHKKKSHYDFNHIGTVALFGDVARNQNKVDTVYRIYLRDGT